MDDTCVVCAETLDWVAYGPCGHREVCSTCIARLRFIYADRRCCLCKHESKAVFMTKALGDYTRMINEFSIFPDDPSEGKVGPYWCHEGTQAYFDDQDHYKMIKAMCRLSCSVCVKMDGQVYEISKRQVEFMNIEQLKSHLFHKHKLFMCILCLEGRKVFMCEQKLYTQVQLNQHINTGDTEVDGSESDRGGFTGHPLCEFCRSLFYGDDELYLHMSTEHCTCHICQRQHPGRYEYYKNYDHLETHFRGEHYLCEDEGCLAKKFIVFATESQLKRHNAMDHGGNMSRSNASLQHSRVEEHFKELKKNIIEIQKEYKFLRDEGLELAGRIENVLSSFTTQSAMLVTCTTVIFALMTIQTYHFVIITAVFNVMFPFIFAYNKLKLLKIQVHNIGIRKMGVDVQADIVIREHKDLDAGEASLPHSILKLEVTSLARRRSEGAFLLRFERQEFIIIVVCAILYAVLLPSFLFLFSPR